MKTVYLIILLPLLLSLISCSSEKQPQENLPSPKNVIILISDGMGYNHVLATNYYEHGKEKAQVYEQDDWVQFAMTTYNSILSIEDGDTIYSSGYSPENAWKKDNYLTKDYTDSGAGATAISTGKKTFARSIGIGVYGDTLLHISQRAKELGKATGIVSSVPLSHATPAGFIAHNSDRSNYKEIAHYILFESKVDLIMGPGNPDFDNDGNKAENSHRYIGGKELWEQLKINDGRTEFVLGEKTFSVKDMNNDGKPNPWRLIQSREEFVDLIENPTGERILGVPKIYATLQSERTLPEKEEKPFSTPLNEAVPTLEEMTKAALSMLAQNENGFFIMIEGGAVDWASHDNNSARMIEEQIDFNNSVKAAVEWLNKYSSWDETLIIVTSDHECGYLTGPSHPEILNSPVKNMGKGNMPAMKWNFDHHTNQLVPFYAKGPGAELFELFADEYDPKRGAYIQNSDIAKLIFLLWK